ncbi:MAG TPA: MEDS domain-containing protein [Terracidiphilus sp.]|nr:MEDS domain-containing protein [Terracidiphilus sp.]
MYTAGLSAASSEHVAQFYGDDEELLDTLTHFIGGGLNAGDSAIVIATPQHLRALRNRLERARVDLLCALREDRYIPLDANVALTSFMVDGWPDDQLFADFAGNLLQRASRHSRRVRAFGEMVALLWEDGEAAATVKLEQLWNRACESHTLSLLCAYPSTAFSGCDSQALFDLCTAHQRSFLSVRAESATNFLEIGNK